MNCSQRDKLLPQRHGGHRVQLLSTLLRQISWSHNRLIMSRCKTKEEREFYLLKAYQERYSFRQLDRQISAALYERTQVSQPK